jgi:hypothetical protein
MRLAASVGSAYTLPCTRSARSWCCTAAHFYVARLDPASSLSPFATGTDFLEYQHTLLFQVRVLMQKAVSGNKRRFIDKEFDLDLTYIADRCAPNPLPPRGRKLTPGFRTSSGVGAGSCLVALTAAGTRLVAMALPCVRGAAYRNDIREVPSRRTCTYVGPRAGRRPAVWVPDCDAERLGCRRQVSRFFTSRHYGAFKIFNLCEGFEESGNGNYDQKLFWDQVWTLSAWTCVEQPGMLTGRVPACRWSRSPSATTTSAHCRPWSTR